MLILKLKYLINESIMVEVIVCKGFQGERH